MQKLPSASLPSNCRDFPELASRFSGLSRTKVIFQDFPEIILRNAYLTLSLVPGELLSDLFVMAVFCYPTDLLLDLSDPPRGR